MSTQKLQFSSEFQGYFHHNVKFVPFGSNHVFPDFFILLDRKLCFIGLSGKKTYFNGIFYQAQLVLRDK